MEIRVVRTVLAVVRKGNMTVAVADVRRAREEARRHLGSSIKKEKI